MCRPKDPQIILARGAPLLGDIDRELTRKILSSDALLGPQYVDRRSFGHDMPPSYACPRPEVNHVVRCPHRVFVVFHYQHRIAHVAKLSQRIEQTVIVARVEPNRRFVQNVEHADQTAADLSGQPDSLCFAAGQRWCGARKSQIVQANIQQKTEAATDLLESFGGDYRAGIVELQLLEEKCRVGNRQ